MGENSDAYKNQTDKVSEWSGSCETPSTPILTGQCLWATVPKWLPLLGAEKIRQFTPHKTKKIFLFVTEYKIIIKQSLSKKGLLTRKCVDFTYSVLYYVI